MEYSKLVAVTGMPGLFELINSKGDGAIIRSLDDKSTKFISSRVHNFSHLESIEVYTNGDNVSLAEVLLSMKEKQEKLPDEKDPAAVKKYFEKVYPDLDFERVYNSDLKKMVRWFAVLQDHNIEITLPEEEQQEEEPTEDVTVEDSNDQKKENVKPGKKESGGEEKPAKKSSSRKK